MTPSEVAHILDVLAELDEISGSVNEAIELLFASKREAFDAGLVVGRIEAREKQG